MAEKWTIAFGRYLRTLRERRGLSLDAVQSLSEAFPDPIRKAYLSRCENGRQSLAFSKLVALCRIYEVPPEVLTERLQLDMELEKAEAPSTEGHTFEELVVAGVESLRKGFGWHAYAYLRDAIPMSSVAPVREAYAGRSEQVLVAYMNCATVSIRLGRTRFPLHEYRHVSSSAGLSPRYSVIAIERVAECYRRLGRLLDARKEIEHAVSLANEHQDNYSLGYCYSGRAVIAVDENEYETASQFYEKAYSCYRSEGLRNECSRTLLNLAQCYFYMGRMRAARRAVKESLRIANELDFRKSEALGKILLGEIELLEGRVRNAMTLLEDAAKIAESLDDRVVWFKAEFQLFRHAVQADKRNDAERLRQQLSRLKAWIPADTPELQEFFELVN